MLNASVCTVKTEEEDQDYSQSAGSENSFYSEANFEDKLEELEAKVMKLIEFVIHDINQLKKTSRKKYQKKQANKENTVRDIWKCRIYVGNINPNTPIEMLSDYFSKYGEIVHAFFIRTSPTCNNAHIEFKNQSSAEKAKKQSHFLTNRELIVGSARLRSESTYKEPLSFKAKTTDYKVLRYRPY